MKRCTLLFGLLLTVIGGAATADGNVDEFVRKTGFSSGGEYVTRPEARNCSEGELSIEADSDGGVLIRLGPDILAEALGEKSIELRDGSCTITFKTLALREGRIDAMKEKRCPDQALAKIQWHNEFTKTAEGFIYKQTYTSGRSKTCNYVHR